MSSGYNSETLRNPVKLINYMYEYCIVKFVMNKVFKMKITPNPGRGAIRYGTATPGIDRVPELYPEDTLRNPTELSIFPIIHV